MSAGMLFVAGLSHRTAPVDLREQLALEEDKLREIQGDVLSSGVLAEVMILSTCNRVEAYGVAEAPGEARALVFRRLCQQRGVDLGAVEPTLYTRTDAEAVQHAFRVAASLDSMIVGEPQILGQVKDAFAIAQSCQSIGPALHRLWTRAFAVAKKVRAETGVAQHAVSVSFAAVELAKKIFGGLEGRSVLLVGAGEMGELASRHLVDQGACPIYVANRTSARAQELARSLAGTAVPFGELASTMASVDIVVSSTGAPAPIITREAVQRAMHARRSRPLFFVDIAVPRDVEPGLNELDNVFCYDIDDLKQVVDANLRERVREAQRAEAMIRSEVERFTAGMRDGEVVPTIVSLRERLETIRRAEVAKALSRLPDASPETRLVVEGLSNAIVNKILHTPITKLRESTRSGLGRSWMELVHELFGLRPHGR
jgi:glutamyl-tRNA reductase